MPDHHSTVPPPAVAPLASTGSWTLYHRVGRDGPGWINLKLVDSAPYQRVGRRTVKRVRNFWLAWNGRRLAKTNEAKRLAELHPKLYDWIVSTLTAGCPPIPPAVERPAREIAPALADLLEYHEQ